MIFIYDSTDEAVAEMVSRAAVQRAAAQYMLQVRADAVGILLKHFPR